MGIQDLQAFLDSNAVQGGSLPVDLLRIARNVTQRQRSRAGKGQQQPPSAKLRLVLDGECCLDRLYGGYFSGKVPQVAYFNKYISTPPKVCPLRKL